MWDPHPVLFRGCRSRGHRRGGGCGRGSRCHPGWLAVLGADINALIPEIEARESILEIQVNAALAGHDLGPFEPVEVLTGGYEARCRKCNQSAWVGDSRYCWWRIFIRHRHLEDMYPLAVPLY